MLIVSPKPDANLLKTVPAKTDVPQEDKPRMTKAAKFSRSRGRWVIFIIFLLSVLASLYCYFRAELPLLLKEYL